MGFFILSGTTMALPASVNAPMVLALPGHAVTLTAYNAVPEQTDDDPLVTASGAYSNPEIIAARSVDLADKLPFGTIIAIDGPSEPDNSCGYGVVKQIIGYRVIADSMNARYTDRIDILFSTKSNYIMANGSVKNAGAILGICDGVTVREVGFIDLTHTSHIPDTQTELAAIVKSGGLALK